MLLHGGKPVNALVVGEGLVIIGDQARRGGIAEVDQSGVPQMAVDQHIGPEIILARSDTQRLDNTDLGD